MTRRVVIFFTLTALVVALLSWVFEQPAGASGASSAVAMPSTLAALGPPCGPECAEVDDSWLDYLTEPLFKMSASAMLKWITQSIAGVFAFLMMKITQSTTPVVNGNAQNGDWFAIQYQMMMNVGWWLMMPLIFVTIIHSILRGSMQLLIRSILMYLPLTVLGTVLATNLIQALIQIVDDMCLVFIRLIESDLSNFQLGLTRVFNDAGLGIVMGILLGTILLIFSLYLWVVFILRDASVYMAVMFMPVGFAMMVWPVAGRYFRKMVEFLIGIIVAKLVMVVIISLSIAAFAGSTGHSTGGIQQLYPDGRDMGSAADVRTDSYGGPGEDGVAGTDDDRTPVEEQRERQRIADEAAGRVPGAKSDDPANIVNTNALDTEGMAGFWQSVFYIFPAIVMLGMAALSPPMTIKLVGNLGIGEMAGQVADSMNTQSWLYQYIGAERMTRIFIENPRRLIQQFRKGREIKRRLENVSRVSELLSSIGIHENKYGHYQIDEKDLEASQLSDEQKEWVRRATRPDNMNINEIAAAHYMVRGGKNVKAVHLGDANSAGTVIEYKDGKSLYIADLCDRRTLKPISTMNKTAAAWAIDQEASRQKEKFGHVKGITVLVPAIQSVRSEGEYMGKTRRQERWLRNWHRIADRANAKYGSGDRIRINPYMYTRIEEQATRDPSDAYYSTRESPTGGRKSYRDPGRKRRKQRRHHTNTDPNRRRRQ